MASAIETYTARQIEAAAKLETIKELLEAHQDKQAPEDIHWGHAGDLGLVNQNLDDIIAFLSPIKEV